MNSGRKETVDDSYLTVVSLVDVTALLNDSYHHL